MHDIEQVKGHRDTMGHSVVASRANRRDFLDWASIIGAWRAGRACRVGHRRAGSILPRSQAYLLTRWRWRSCRSKIDTITTPRPKKCINHNFLHTHTTKVANYGNYAKRPYKGLLYLTSCHRGLRVWCKLDGCLCRFFGRFSKLDAGPKHLSYRNPSPKIKKHLKMMNCWKLQCHQYLIDKVENGWEDLAVCKDNLLLQLHSRCFNFGLKVERNSESKQWLASQESINFWLLLLLCRSKERCLLPLQLGPLIYPTFFW